MIKHKNMGLAGFCVVLIICFGAAALAIGPNDAPDPKSDKQTSRKGGDLWIGYYGGRYHSRSGRLGSVGNRSFRGGGVHGGK